MRPPHSFVEFLHTLAWNNKKSEKKDLSNLSTGICRELSQDFVRLIDATSASRVDIEAQVGLLLCTKKFWALVPEKLFYLSEPNYERIAKEKLNQQFFGQVDDMLVKSLALIYRNLRRANECKREGLTTFDYRSIRQKKILESQSNRCACCGYLFNENELIYSYADLEDFKRKPTPEKNEITLEFYYRSPVLDHIIPYYISGDHESNWQILCFSCNSGKGESLSWMLRSGWMPVRRLGDVTVLTSSLRYSVISKYLSNKTSSEQTSHELKVFKKNNDSLLFFENLEVRPESKISSKLISYTEQEDSLQ